MAPSVLIVFGSSHGQTARIARRIEQQLVQSGIDVTMRRGDGLPHDLRLGDYDGVLVGASMIVGGYQRYIRSFVARNARTLNAMPSAFFAVSGSAGSASAEERAEAVRIAQAFLRKAGWRPALFASIAGAIMYTKYNFLLRYVMKRISQREGGSTDTSRDHEYTDWVQVEQFAESFATLVASPHDRADPESSLATEPDTAVGR